MQGRRGKRLVLLALLVLSCWVAPVLPQPLKIIETYVDTDGRGKAVAVRNYHVFLADGPRGLKIFNLSYPRAATLTGRISIPGAMVEDVAVDGDLAVLIDPTNKRLHFVNVWDVMRPRVVETTMIRGDMPRRVALAGNRAFVAERGDDPSAKTFFSGMEVIVHRGSPRERRSHLIAIDGINDVLVPKKQSYPYVLVAARNEILVFRKTVTQSDPKALGRVTLPEGEQIQSLAFHDGYVFAFGINGLYVAGSLPKVFAFPNLDLKYLLRGSLGNPPEQPVDVNEPLSSRLSVIDEAPVEGPQEYRRIDAAVLPLDDYGWTTDPYVALLLTTATSYGIYMFDLNDQELLPFDMGYWMQDSSESFVMRDLPKEVQEKVTIYDSGFPGDFRPGFVSGGVMGVGAIGSYGFGYVRGEQ